MKELKIKYKRLKTVMDMIMTSIKTDQKKSIPKPIDKDKLVPQ